MNFCWNTEVEDGKGSEKSINYFVIKTSTPEMVSLWKGEKKIV